MAHGIPVARAMHPVRSGMLAPRISRQEIVRELRPHPCLGFPDQVGRQFFPEQGHQCPEVFRRFCRKQVNTTRVFPCRRDNMRGQRPGHFVHNSAHHPHGFVQPLRVIRQEQRAQRRPPQTPPALKIRPLKKGPVAVAAEMRIQLIGKLGQRLAPFFHSLRAQGINPGLQRPPRPDFGPPGRPERGQKRRGLVCAQHSSNLCRCRHFRDNIQHGC